MELTSHGREVGVGKGPGRVEERPRRGDGLPSRLEAVLDQRTLAGLVLQAVRRVDDSELAPPVKGPSLAFQPRAMLATLAYCYAIGVYGSWDVEQMMYEDAEFRALCGVEYPDSRRVRRFRRDNLAVLRRTLAETFRSAWSFSSALPPVPGRSPELEGAKAEDTDWFAEEAAARIERARFIDLMEVE